MHKTQLLIMKNKSEAKRLASHLITYGYWFEHRCVEGEHEIEVGENHHLDRLARHGLFTVQS